MRISVFGSRIRNNKFPSSNLSGIVWTGPNITSLVVGSKKKSLIGSLPEKICYLKSHFNVSIVWERQHLLRMTSLADRTDVLLRKAVLHQLHLEVKRLKMAHKRI